MAEQRRQDPDQLLQRLQQDEARARRGKLKIFFGASAGVGKTFAMLEAARAARASGADVVVGYVEPHGRVETERLLEGLERLPVRQVQYRGIVRGEFDLDGALQRAPSILLVDELAHSNLPDAAVPPRHEKRWQDVEELLAAGISVWTTLNVQHLESLNDVVAGITGIRQQETLPDQVFDEADEVELIDLPPDDLLARLQGGKIYLSEQASTAIERFFRRPNLLALREMALRRTADRVDAAARALAQDAGASQPWLARDRFLIAVAPDDQAEHLVRFGKRFATALDAEWIVVTVETPRLLRLGERARNRRIEVLRLAESLGATTVTLDGPNAAATLSQYARLRHIARIVVGAPRRRRRPWRLSTAHQLINANRDFDVSVIARRAPGSTAPGRDSRGVREVVWGRYGIAAIISLLCTGLAELLYARFELTNLVMIYLLGATVAALRLGRGPATLTAVLNVAAFDFCFVPPRFSFAVSDLQYLITFAVMLAVALIIANLVANVRAQSRVAGARERRTALLYAMSRELAVTREREALARAAVRHVSETFESQAVVLLPDASGRLHYPRGAPSNTSLRGADLSVAQWVLDHTQPAGFGTDTLPGSAAQYLPLKATSATLGVLAVLPLRQRRLLLPEQRHLLETFAGQIALALERSELAEAAATARVAAETESLRNTLLASISHDLRTPLAVIAGASSALRDEALALEAPVRAELISAIEAKAKEMSDLISNVLDLMRFESGEVALRQDWELLDDLIAVSLRKAAVPLANHVVTLDLPAELPAIFVDGALLTQLFVNLLENAARHTPPGTHVRIGAEVVGEHLDVTFDDDGPGLPPGDPERLFAKFQRGRDEGNTGGAGLGLAICQSIARAHGGHVAAQRRPEGGARFTVTLPLAAPASP